MLWTFFTPHSAPIVKHALGYLPLPISDIELNDVLGESHCVTTMYNYGLFRAYICQCTCIIVTHWLACLEGEGLPCVCEHWPVSQKSLNLFWRGLGVVY